MAQVIYREYVSILHIISPFNLPTYAVQFLC
jgi:hypothetical protein